MLDSIKVALETNDLLEDDFSEVVGPVRALEGIHQRAAGQLYEGGRRTSAGRRARSCCRRRPGWANGGDVRLL